ncbi:MAG: hypothetical protein IPI39_07510 [Candidatus Obscuribacter sp.]|nr:hypothetical protein [Candidatus Obscuribacter sp.]
MKTQLSLIAFSLALALGSALPAHSDSEASLSCSSEASLSASSEARRGGSSEAQWGTSSSEAQWGTSSSEAQWGTSSSEASLSASSESGFARQYGQMYGNRGLMNGNGAYGIPKFRRRTYPGGPPQVGYQPPDPSSRYATLNRINQDTAAQIYHEVHLASEPTSDFIKTYGSTPAPQTISSTDQANPGITTSGAGWTPYNSAPVAPSVPYGYAYGGTSFGSGSGYGYSSALPKKPYGSGIIETYRRNQQRN